MGISAIDTGLEGLIIHTHTPKQTHLNTHTQQTKPDRQNYVLHTYKPSNMCECVCVLSVLLYYHSCLQIFVLYYKIFSMFYDFLRSPFAFTTNKFEVSSNIVK